ncbi:MAG: hypothetical protein JWQ38_2775 [Flavipsychrobacter sp.]|nr:hypothetical protein [Flavipsychrobacter sp.]
MTKTIWCFAFFMLGTMGLVNAQGPKVEAPRVRLGTMDTAYVTCEALLSNTKLIPVDPKWKVTSFSISFTLPDGKTYGPFPTEGNDLNDQEKKLIKRLKGKNSVIDITQIKVLYNGKEKYTYPIMLRYNQ